MSLYLVGLRLLLMFVVFHYVANLVNDIDMGEMEMH